MTEPTAPAHSRSVRRGSDAGCVPEGHLGRRASRTSRIGPVDAGVHTDITEQFFLRRRGVATLSPVLKQATGVVAARGEGALIFDEDGRRYLDFTAGIGVTSTGHCHPKVVAAAQEQVGRIIHAQYTTVIHRPLLDLVDRM